MSWVIFEEVNSEGCVVIFESGIIFIQRHVRHVCLACLILQFWYKITDKSPDLVPLSCIGTVFVSILGLCWA